MTMPSPVILYVGVGVMADAMLAWRLAIGRLAKLRTDGPLAELARRDGDFRYVFRSFAFFAGGHREVGDPRLSTFVTVYWLFLVGSFAVLATYLFLVFRGLGMI